eukprot:753799-Hanusia_phi.AAC.1
MSGREEEELMKHSRDLLSADKLSLLASRQSRAAQDVHGRGSSKRDDLFSKLETLSSMQAASSARFPFKVREQGRDMGR